MVRSRRSRATTAIAVVAALAVIASACGSSAKKGGSNTNNGPTTTLGVVGNDESKLTPVAGGSLTYGIEADTSGGIRDVGLGPCDVDVKGGRILEPLAGTHRQSQHRLPERGQLTGGHAWVP